MPPFIELSISKDRKSTLCGRLKEIFQTCFTARITQIDSKYTRWMDNYSAKPLEAIRTTPFYRASNFVPQLIRMHTDILSARIFGLILSTKPMWNPMTLGKIPHEMKEGLSRWMQYKSLYDLRLPEIFDTGVYRAFKTGSCILKGPWVEDRRWKVSGLGKTVGSLQQEEKITSFLDLRPVAFDDVWVWPITVQYLRDAKAIFHRLRMTKEDVEFRKANKIWDPDACDAILNTPEQSSGTAREAQAAEAGISLTPDVVRPYTAIEATIEYQLEPGKIYEIIVVFNPKASADKAFLRGYYNPLKKLRNCYAEIKFLPREDFIYGYSIPEILEQSQEEQAQIHNARRDSNTIGNIPTFKTKRYSDQPNPSAEWYPGKVFVLEQMDDMDVLNLQVNYNSMIDEERFLMSLAEQYTGVQPPMQGYGSGVLAGKRGIYSSQGTLAMLAEGNQRLNIYLHRARYPFHDIGNLIYQTYKQFQPNGSEYTMWGETGEAVRQSFKFEEPADYPGFFFNIAAADAGANREVERTSLLLMANTMGAYYRQITEAAASITQLPKGHPLAAVLLAVLDGAKDLANRLLFAFDQDDRKRLVPDVRAVLGGSPEAAAQQSERTGLPPTEEPLSVDGLRSLSENLNQVPSGNGSAPAGGR
jgi:hypothetical protein